MAKTKKPVNFVKLTLAQKVKRWVQLYEALGRLTPHERKEHWDMGEWGMKTPCGTVACAAGHASFDPKVQRTGFVGKFNKYGEIRFSVEPEYFYGDVMTDEVFCGMGGTVGDVRKGIKRLITRLKKKDTTGDGETDSRIESARLEKQEQEEEARFQKRLAREEKQNAKALAQFAEVTTDTEVTG